MSYLNADSANANRRQHTVSIERQSGAPSRSLRKLYERVSYSMSRIELSPEKLA